MKMKTKRATALSLTMFGLGAASFLVSVYYSSTILALIGLGLAFWGGLLLYVRSQEYAPKALIEATVMPSLASLDQIVRTLEFKGEAVYLPPKYFDDPENAKIYISKHQNAELPSPEQVQKHENQLIIKNPQGILLTPPGEELAKLAEKALDTSFTRVDLEYLQHNLPKTFVEDLEIAENLQIDIIASRSRTKVSESVSVLSLRSEAVNVRITAPVYKEIASENQRQTQSKIGDPICSSIACALAKATGKPIIIQKIQPTEDGKTIEATYRILETTETQENNEQTEA